MKSKFIKIFFNFESISITKYWISNLSDKKQIKTSIEILIYITIGKCLNLGVTKSINKVQKPLIRWNLIQHFSNLCQTPTIPSRMGSNLKILLEVIL